MSWLDQNHDARPASRVDSFRRLPVLAALALATISVSVAARAATPQTTPPAAPPATAQVPPPAAQAPAPQITEPATQVAVSQPGNKPTLPPGPPPTAEQLGDTYMARQRYQAAIEAYKKGSHDSGVIWNKMGIAYQLMFNLDEATRCYEKSLRLDPKNPTVMNNLGTVYDSLKEYPTAERMYKKALKYDSKSALINKNLGTNLLTQHKYKKGWEYYKAALAIDPDVFERSASPRVENPATVEDRGAMNYYMARGCVRAGMNDQAIEYLRMALNEGFTNPKKIMADIEFAGLHGIPAFEQLLASQSAQ
jgi:tetratricopeptide (TPR) repeat protein